MSEPKTIMIDNELYVRQSDTKPISIGDKRIVVADRGWVFVGDCTDEDDGSITIQNAKNIRIWGTKKGLGELVNGATSKTVTDEYGTVNVRPIITIAVIGGW